MTGGEIRGAKFVKAGIIHADGVSIDRRAFELARHRDDHARIESSGKVRTDGHIGAQPFFDGVHQHLLEFIHQLPRIPAGIFLPLIWEIHLPVSALGDERDRTGFVAGPDVQIVAGGQKLHAFKTRDRPR